jgi:glucoside 3-dehydrogenase (cytochrome c) hitch-hiker subunit
MPIGPVVSRRAALKALAAGAGAVTLLPWLSEEGVAAFAEIQRAKAPPRLLVLTSAQYQTVEALVEAIIPADERSPGAREARVADYIDLLLSEAPTFLKQRWLNGLAALDAESASRFGSPFLQLPAVQVEALLGDISRNELLEEPAPADPALALTQGEQPKLQPPQLDTLLGEVRRPDPRLTPREAFFADTKQATIHGYYTSEIGIHEELRYKGNTLLAEFVGCETVEGRDCPHCGQKAEG